MNPYTKIAFVATRNLALGALNTNETNATLAAKFLPSSTTIAAIAQNINITEFGILVARPTRQSMVSMERQLLFNYPYIDTQTNTYFSYRSSPNSKGSSLNLQFISFFQSGGLVGDTTMSSTYNNACLASRNSNANFALRSIDTIQVISDGYNVLQQCAPESLECTAFAYQNAPYDRLGSSLKFNYEDCLYFNWHLCLKYYKGNNIFDGKDNTTKECSLIFSATTTVDNASTYDFFLISIYTRILLFDEFGNAMVA